MAERNVEEPEAIQPAEEQRHLFKEAPTNPGGKYFGADLEPKTTYDNGDSPFADSFDFTDLLWRCQS